MSALNKVYEQQYLRSQGLDPTSKKRKREEKEKERKENLEWMKEWMKKHKTTQEQGYHYDTHRFKPSYDFKSNGTK